METCPEKTELVEQRVDRVLTQYRESPKLLHVMRVYLGQVADAALAGCTIPSFFDLDTAVGDQLTLIGKRIGFPRCHCVCNIQPVYGFECEGYGDYQIVGFCDENGAWADCGPFGTSDTCITDDEMYRRFLKARRYQMMALFDIASLTAAVQHLFGEQAGVLSAGNGRVVIAPGRDLTAGEIALLQIYPRVLPVAPGIRIRFHFGATRVFGFGEGWGNFCEPWQPDGLPLITENGDIILVSTGPDTADEDVPLLTGPLTKAAPFICEVDVKAFSCT